MPKNLHSSKNKGKYRRYRDQGHRIKNKIARLKRHIKKHDKDNCAVRALELIK